MKTLSLVAATLLALPWPNQVVRAEMTATTQTEIGHLLDRIAQSSCEFNSDGTWYSSVMAHFHLRDKYEQMQAEVLISSTEEFIRSVASESADSGQPYQVRCDGAPLVTSGQWLGAELARFRLRYTKSR